MTKNPHHKPNPIPGFERYIPPPVTSTDRTFDDLTAREIAAAFRVTVQAIDAWCRTGCPFSKIAGRLTFNLSAVIAWRRARDAEKSNRPFGDDPLLDPNSPDSPALERYRALKGDLAELDLAEKRGQLIPRDQLLAQWQTAAAALRTHLEAIERAHGRPVGDAIRTALDQTQTDLQINQNAHE